MSKRNCDEESVHTQEKFRCLIEQREKARKEWAVKKPTWCQQKKDILQFIEDNQSFCGVIHEAACAQQHSEESNISGAVSSVMVEECVTMLKSQASQSFCPLDLLAAETLADRLLSLNKLVENLATETRPQLLSSQDKGVVLILLRIIKRLLSEHSFNRVHFAKCLTVKGHVLPLEAVWMLHSECVISLNTYFACCLQDNMATSKLASSLESICHYSDTSTKQIQEKILSGILSTLLPLAYPENRAAAEVTKSSNRTLKKVSQDILWLLTKDKEADSLVQQGTHSSRALQVLEVIRTLSYIPNAVVNRFFTSYINKLLSSPSTVTVYEAVSSQKRWVYSSQPTGTRSNYEQILCVFKPAVIMEFIRNAVEKVEVNWHKVLSFLSVFVICVKEAAGVIEAYVSELIANALAECNNHRLSAAFLIERQAALEGAHVFQPYVTWFESLFGETTPIVALSTKKSVQFFMKFLADLVPYEPAEYLKVHVIKAPSVSSKLRSHVTDYVALARTRLADLKEPVELGGMFSDSSESGAESKTEHAKQGEQAARDVGKVLETFQKSGRVPSSVMEASIFRKPYFIGRFLPALLIPRKLPDVPDTRIQLIETLKKAGKIPNGMMTSYISACEKLALEHIEASSSSDDSAVSNMGKLVKTLRQFTVAVMAELDKRKPSRTPSVTATLSALSTNIRAAMSSCSTQCIVDDFPALLDFQAPGLHEKDVQVCDAVLNSFCKTYAAINGMDLINSSERKRHQWTRCFVAMISSIPDLHVTLAYRLWCLLINQGTTLQEHHICGLACFLCCISAYHSLMKQIVFTGLGNGLWSNEINLSVNKAGVAELLCQNIPNHSGKDMVFSLRFYCAIIQHAFTSSENVTTELSSKGAASDSLCYVPPTAVKKLWYLFNRLRRGQHEQLQMHHNLDEPLKNASHLIKTDVFQKLREESACQVSFKEWLMWEISVNPLDDLLKSSERQEYLWSTVHDHFIPQEASRGGCDGSTALACSVVFNSLLDCHVNRKLQSLQPCSSLDGSIGNKEDVTKLLQELVLLLPGLGSRTETSQADTLPEQWLLNTFFSRLHKIEEESKDRRLNQATVAFSLSREVEEFLRITMLLPPNLLFSNITGFSAKPENIEKMETFVNDYLRTYQSELCCLPLNVTSHLLKGLLSSVVGPGTKPSPQDEVREKIVKKFLRYCPLFFISLQYHWKHVIPIVSTMVDPTVMGETARLYNWVSSLFNLRQSLPPFGEVCELDPYVVGGSLYLALTQRHCDESTPEGTCALVERLVAVLEPELRRMEAFATNVCTSLFDCVVARFSELHLHGKEMKINAAFLGLVSKLCAVCPSVLNVFGRGKGLVGEEQKSFNLRHLVIDEKLIKLYPLAFFSIFMEVSSTVLEKFLAASAVLLCEPAFFPEVFKGERRLILEQRLDIEPPVLLHLLHTKGFIRVMLEMHLELAQLRKNCLEETTSPDVVNKFQPFDIDFDCQVSSFVRRCTQRSPLEILRALPEELVGTICPNLRNLLRSRTAGGYSTAQR